ncbi:hypothetical protein C4569_04170 [Candidatus Parcubacteria bacterium]|nr:MAG: hypothetical protein C4569_04170 [Candidatus Parcubacteria bacterium]
MSELRIFLKKQPVLVYFILFFIVFLFFLVLHANSVFPDPDSFYHAKMAELMRQEGVIYDFPYLQFTTLKEEFTDHHFLYHLLLIPFISLSDAISGIKLATVFFAAIFIVTFYYLLNKNKYYRPLFFVLVILATNPFIFRLNLAKAQGLALIFFLLGIIFLTERKTTHLFFFSFLYVWTYGGWPIIFILTLAFIASSYLVLDFGLVKKSAFKGRGSGWKKKFLFLLTDRIFDKKLQRQNLKLFLSVGSGLVAGIVINPYFPQNLFFYWQQIIHIAVINYRDIIAVGGEWYSYDFKELAVSAFLVLFLFFAALINFLVQVKKQNQNTWFFLAVTVFFLILTLKSRRNVEYFIPSSLLFSSASLKNFFDSPVGKNMVVQFGKLARNGIIIAECAIAAALLLIIAGRGFYYEFLELRNGFRIDRFEKAALWLKENSAPGSVVFHSDWDDFPLLFFHNSENNYIVGLDPTFMYNYNNDLYWKWHNITIGEDLNGLYESIKNDFKSSYVLVDYNSNSGFDSNLMNNFYFDVVYSDSEAKIYKVLKDSN